MKRLIPFLLIILSLIGFWDSPTAQAQSGIVTLNIHAGFGGRFRDNMWTPVQVRLQNTGAPFSGTLMIRPERTRGLTNPVSTPIDLPRDAIQTVTLYVSLRSFTDTLRVELFTPDGLIAAEAETSVNVILPHERLYVRISDTLSSTINLTNAANAGQVITQADITLATLPDRSVGLEAVDVLVISNTDTEPLTITQRSALREWIIGGGHLITTGGSNYQATAIGLRDLLPFNPDASITTDDFNGLATLAGAGYSLDENTATSIIATGQVVTGARVLAQNQADQPLIIRQQLGAGMIDYLTFDPLASPFDRWSGQPQLWLTLIGTREAHPSWASGFVNIAQGYNAIEILPGVTVLPEATAMAVFLVMYILLIGPVNYLVLSRLGRRELAWVTIPAFILIFTVAAWVTGFNLRGEEVILSRLSVVESWVDTPDSRVRQLIGLLAPRRANYQLTLDDGRALRPLLRSNTGLLSNAPNPVEIVQDDAFRAVDFPVDASFMAGFIAEGHIAGTAITGDLTILEGDSTERWRGTLQNNLSTPLTDVVLLSRHGVYRLDTTLMPNQLQPIEATIAHRTDKRSNAAAIQYAVSFAAPAQYRSTTRNRLEALGPETTIREIVGENQFSVPVYYGLAGAYLDQTLTQEQTRRQLFLSNFILDQFAATGRGDAVYVIGWSQLAPTTENIGNTAWRSVDTTVYIAELNVNRQPQAGQITTVHPDEFTWLTIADEGATNSTPNTISYYNDGALAYRFTPLPTKHLAQVTGLTVVVEETNVSFSNVQLGLYDWRAGEYVPIELQGTRTPIPNPERFIGPLNAVQIEIRRVVSSGSLAISRLGIEQTGQIATQ